MNPWLFWNIVNVEARKRMSYRADFWINSIAGVLINFSVFWFLTHALFAASGRPMLAGFTPRGMVFYYAFAILMARLVQSNEMDMGIAQDIYDGSLNRYLLYPVPYTAFKYAQQAGWLAPQAVQLLVFGALASLLLGIPQEVRITPASVAMCAVSLALANVLHYLMTVPIHAVAFWADNVWSLMVAQRLTVSLLGGLLLPLSLFPQWAQDVLAWLPFPYLFSMPVRTLFGQVGPGEWAAGLGIAALWCMVMIGVARIVWRRGDLRYTGVGI